MYKTNSNANSNFTNEVRISKINEFNIPKPKPQNTVVYVFITSPLDCCNLLLFSISDTLTKCFQVVQNATAWLVLKSISTSHPSWGYFISCQCISKLNLNWTSWFTRHWMPPQYMVDDYHNYNWPLMTWSSNVEVTRTCTNPGDRSFIDVGLHLWHNLPLHLHDSELTLLEFHQLLKTPVLLRTAALSDCCL